MEHTRKELIVSALENGTVLDHIPAENVYKALDILGLKDINSQITTAKKASSRLPTDSSRTRNSTNWP